MSWLQIVDFPMRIPRARVIPGVVAAVLAGYSVMSSGAEAATSSEMKELVRLLRANGPAGKTIIAESLGSSKDEPLIIASYSPGANGRSVVTIAFESRVGMMMVGGIDKGPGSCHVVLQDIDEDGVPDNVEFNCDRISAEMPKALSALGQPLFDDAVRSLIRRLATV